MISRPTLACVAGFAIVLAPASELWGQAASGKAKIAEAAQASVEQLDPEKIAEIDSAKESFLASVDSLRTHLSQATGEANADAWLNYLMIDPVLDGISEDRAASALALDAIRMSQRATGTHPGLEVPAVRSVRRSAILLSNALRFRQREKTTEVLARQLAAFPEKWLATADVPSPTDVESLSLLLGLLEKTGQSVPLLEQTQAVFSHPNAHVMVGESLVHRAINRDVNQPSPVRDCILGTRIIGNALLVGDVTADVLPAEGSIRVQLALRGTVTSNNTGYNGPVRLRTSSIGDVYSTRVLSVSDGLVQLEPIQTTASLATRINRIEHKLRLVRKIARKRAAQQKPRADSIARSRLVNRISDEFGQETDQAMAGTSPDLMARVRPILERLDLAEPARSIGSTTDLIYASMTFRKGEQLSAPVPAPAIEAEHDLAFQVHESLVNNTIGGILAGRTMNRIELKDLVAKLAPADEQAVEEEGEQEENFEIDFDRSRPIIFEARDGKLRVGLRGTRFQEGEGKRELKKRLEIAATYEPVVAENGDIVLSRVDAVKVSFPGTKRLSVSQAGMRPAIEKGFADAFPATLMDEPFVVPETVRLPALRNLAFRAKQVDAQDGWLTVGVGI